MFDHPRAFLPLVLMVLLVGFSVYRRARRHIGRQPYRPTAMKVRIGIFCALAVTFISLTPSLPNIAGALAGAIGGGALGLYSAHLARIERTEGSVFYTGNAYIGLGVTALLIARVGYRLIGAATAINSAAAHAGATSMAPQPAFASSIGTPLTLGIILVTFSYYVAYYAGLIGKVREFDTT